MTTLRALLGSLSLCAVLAGCGDVGNVSVNLAFSDPALEAATRRILFVVREEPIAGGGCDAIWSDEPTGLAETRGLMDYPNKNDVLAVAVALSKYPMLSVFAYALPTRDAESSDPIAGGCEDVKVDPDGTLEATITLEPAP
ncbi:hypothetical protein L6R52_30015 [Myxococcota bacterium]|nr:hypothetical protein [Myxococcota bacterium]